MTTTSHPPGLLLGGRRVDGEAAWTEVLRYCGIPIDDEHGDPGQTWAWRFFDAITTDPAGVSPQDVVCAAALHDGLTHAELDWFWAHQVDLDNWLSSFPVDLALRHADEDTIGLVTELPARFPGVSLSLLTKVLHRKRPWLIPMVDRGILDWYRPLTGQRSAEAAWAPLVRLIAEDLRTNEDQLAHLRLLLCILHRVTVTDVRTIDIVIWMSEQR